jgi:hypothetical protein
LTHKRVKDAITHKETTSVFCGSKCNSSKKKIDCRAWISLKIVYLCRSVRGHLPGIALLSTPDRDKILRVNKY